MVRKPRVLILLNRVPYPLDDGWKVRTYHLVRAVAATCETTIVCAARGESEPFADALGASATLHFVPGAEQHRGLQLLSGLVGRDPLYVTQERSAVFREAVERALRAGQDLVLCELTALYEHVRGLGVDGRVVIDTHNVDSAVFTRYATSQPTFARRLYSRITARKMRRYEEQVFGRVGAVVVCSTPEEPQVLEIAPTANVWVIPNGATLAPPPDAARPAGHRMLFFGRLDYHPNVDAIEFFLEHVFPVIRAAIPDAEFDVAGAADDGTIAALMGRHPGATFHGRVPSLEPVIASADLVVVPLRVGGGTRLKILEALAAGRPVLSTAIGAEGLELEPGEEIALADDAVSFAGKAVALLRDPRGAGRLGMQGRSAVESKYGWPAIGREFARRLAALAGANGIGA